MIILPLHGQNTAALQPKVSGQAILQKLTRKDVIVIQTLIKHCRIPHRKLSSNQNNTNKQFNSYTTITKRKMNKIKHINKKLNHQ